MAGGCCKHSCFESIAKVNLSVCCAVLCCACRFFNCLDRQAFTLGAVGYPSLVTKNTKLTVFVLPSKRYEIAKRAAIFTAVGQVGNMFAGITMTALHNIMEGTEVSLFFSASLRGCSLWADFFFCTRYSLMEGQWWLRIRRWQSWARGS